MNSILKRGYKILITIFILISTREIYAQEAFDLTYNSLIMSISQSNDKVAATKEFLNYVTKTYKKKDAKYFEAYYNAGTLNMVENPRLAIKYLDSAIALGRNNSSMNEFEDNLLKCFDNLSITYKSLGLNSTALNVLELNKDLIQKCSNNSKCIYYNSLGDLYTSFRQYDKAEACYSEVKKILDSNKPLINSNSKDQKNNKKLNAILEDSYRYYRAFNYYGATGTFYFNQKKYDSSVIYFKKFTELVDQQAIKIEKQSPKTEFSEQFLRFNVVNNELSEKDNLLIFMLCKTGRQQEALSYANTILEKAWFFHLTGDLEKSEKLYQEAYVKTDSLKKSSPIYSPSAEIIKSMRLDPAYFNLQCSRKNFSYALQAQLNEIAKSDKSLQEDFLFFSSNEKKEYFTQYMSNVNRFYSVLLSYGEIEPAKNFEVLNKSLQVKGLIMEVTKEQENRLKNLSDATVLSDIEKLKKAKIKYNAFTQVGGPADSISYYSTLINSLQKKINEKIGVPAALIKPVNWKSIQAKLKSTDAYVEIIKIDRDNFKMERINQYWAFIIKNSGDPIAMLLGEGDNFEKGVKYYQNNIRYKIEDSLSYKQYWAKIATNISGKSKIYFCGDGIYHLVNPLTFKNPATNKYLFEEIELIQLLAGRDLLENKVLKPGINKSVLIGNPDFAMYRKSDSSKLKERIVKDEMITDIGVERSGISVLPGTEKEVNSIASLARANGGKVSVLKNAQASESDVKNISNPTILHFATHGIFDANASGESYLRSKLVLAGAADPEPFTIDDYTYYEDGYLTAYEVTQMKLTDTRLVVLSACETGLGDIQSGEGVWGLQRAFQMAGAQNVLGSLWKVNDEATSIFMTSFYKSYYSGTSVSSSYLFAMKETKKLYPEPYYWGAFKLTGF